MLEIICKTCGVVGEGRFEWQIFSNKTKHIRLDCTACGAYIKYVQQTPETLELVGEVPSAQINF